MDATDGTGETGQPRQIGDWVPNMFCSEIAGGHPFFFWGGEPTSRLWHSQHHMPKQPNFHLLSHKIRALGSLRIVHRKTKCEIAQCLAWSLWSKTNVFKSSETSGIKKFWLRVAQDAGRHVCEQICPHAHPPWMRIQLQGLQGRHLLKRRMCGWPGSRRTADGFGHSDTMVPKRASGPLGIIQNG